MEKTKQNKKTKISEPMGSQNHRKYQTKNKKTKMSEPMGNESHREYNKKKQKKQDFRINDSGSRSLVLKSFLLFFLVFSMVFVTHWFWNLVFFCLFLYSRWFWLPIGSEILVFLFLFVFSMVLAIPYIISAVRFLRFPRGCLTECSLHAHGMSNGMPPGCLAGCQNSMNPPCITTLAIEGIPYYRKAKPFTIGWNPSL